jgi:putative PIN family toxin of toxin-antitoxin system
VRVVADTNIIVSGSLWAGIPRQILEGARAGSFQLLTTDALLTELSTVLAREKFRARLGRAGVTVEAVVLALANLAEVVTPAEIPPTIVDDPADDQVLAAAIGGPADLVVSGDQHLLKLGSFRAVRIVTAREALSVLAELGRRPK